MIPVGSATTLCEPPGVNHEEVAAGQDDRDGVGNVAVVGTEVPLAKPAHPASAGDAVQIGDDFIGDESSGTPVPHLPCGVWSASTDWGPIMHPQATPVAQDGMPVCSRIEGDVACIGGSSTDELGRAQQQQKVALIDQYPTGSAVRQKEERKVREEKLAEEGLAQAEINALRKNKKFNQEEHFDDCGIDLGPLEERHFICAFAIQGSFNSAIVHSFLEFSFFCSDSAEGSEDEPEKVLNDKYSLHYLVGRSIADHHGNPPKSTVVHIDALRTYLSQSDIRGSIDVCGFIG